MSILIGLAHEPVFNAAMATQVVFQQPANAGTTAASSIQFNHRSRGPPCASSKPPWSTWTC
ncbi:MAG: hypothetical protein E2579_02415 [Pseudomonas sp.]|nr:hypothetical protein [Pseudomonas sp.]